MLEIQALEIEEGKRKSLLKPTPSNDRSNSNCYILFPDQFFYLINYGLIARTTN